MPIYVCHLRNFCSLAISCNLIFYRVAKVFNMNDSHVFGVDLRNRFSSRITLTLSFSTLALFLMHWVGFWAASFLGDDHQVTRQTVKLFWLDREHNVPSWFSSSLLWTCGVTLLLIAMIKQNKITEYVFHWALLGLVFLVLSMDEAIAMHEWLIEPVRNALGVSGIFHFAWIIPAIILLLIGGIFYIPFLRYLPTNLRVLFILSGAIFLLGAIGMEMIGGAAMSGEISIDHYQIFMPIEELCEMLGLVLFIHGLSAVLASD